MAHSELHCPFCGSDRVQIIDHQQLATNDKETPVDKEIYVHLKCDGCNETFETVGDITYRQPEPRTKKLAVRVEFSVPNNMDKDSFMKNVINSMLYSYNVTSNAKIVGYSFVD